MIRMQDLGRQYSQLKSELDAVWLEATSTGSFIGGEQVRGFETEFAQYLGVEHAVGVANGTDALEIALKALDLPRNSEVIVPANSFIATAEAVTNMGLKVVFADVNDDFLLDPHDFAGKISRRTSAVIVVHLFGRPVDINQIRDLIGKRSVAIVEDCAQAHGAHLGGSLVGTRGDIAAFSFYPGKSLGAFGDAGAIVTNRGDLHDRSFLLAHHGRQDKYDHLIVGRNSRLDSLQAGILRVKLRHLDRWISRRNEVATMYRELLSDVPGLVLPSPLSDGLHGYHLFVVRVPSRDEVFREMVEAGIEVGIHYPIALHDSQPYLTKRRTNVAPKSSSLAREILSLPINESISDEEVMEVSECLRSVLGALPRN